MKYIPVPVAMLAINKPLPVDIWSPQGSLLLRKGQSITSEQHRDKLQAFEASTTPGDAMAWQHAYERMVHSMLRDGVDVQTIAKAPMPSDISERDFVVVQSLHGGWLDLQEVLRGLLYQGGLVIQPLQRLADMEKKAIDLLHKDTDDSLFSLFQALAQDSLGYSATHALLCAVMCELTAPKLGLDALQCQSLRSAALTMNISMAREQDSLARQASPLTDWQRGLIEHHAEKSADLLHALGVDDLDQLDIVRWHHDPDAVGALPRNHASRGILHMADAFVAKMAARKTRAAMAPVKAVRSMVLGAEGDAIGFGSAMAQAVGFYPPGTYVRLASGATALCIGRGLRANTPWVISLTDKDGMPVVKNQPLDTALPEFSIAQALEASAVKVTVPAERIRRIREKIPPRSA